MKYFFSQEIKVSGSTFTLAEANIYHALNSFHSHQEIELIYVKSGEGIVSIADTSKRISGGTMILIGANVPHLFKFETNRYYDYAMKHGKITVPLELLTLHFDPNKLGNVFLALPENTLLNELLDNAKQGLFINVQVLDDVLEKLRALECAANYEQLPQLLQLLNTIAEGQGTWISHRREKKPFKKIDETRLSMVYLYTMDNFYKEIKLRDIAGMIHMVPNAFCHYFRSRTGKTYFEFLISVRIEHACKLLKEKNDSITSVCHDSGFSNLSNFNRYFKLQTGTTPLEFRRSYR